MADVRSDPDAFTFSRPWFEQIGTSGFAAVGAMLGLTISLLFVLNASPAAPAPPTERTAAAGPASELPSRLKPALQVTQSPTQAVAQSPQSLSAPIQQAAVADPAPDQNAAPDGTQVASAPERSPPASQQEAPRRGAALAPSPGRGENTAYSADTPDATTATGNPLHVGPRGGVYHLSKSGKKVYERRRR